MAKQGGDKVCGTRLFEDEQLRHGFAERTRYDDQMLAELPVTDPAQTVRADVEKLLAAAVCWWVRRSRGVAGRR